MVSYHQLEIQLATTLAAVETAKVVAAAATTVEVTTTRFSFAGRVSCCIALSLHRSVVHEQIVMGASSETMPLSTNEESLWNTSESAPPIDIMYFSTSPNVTVLHAGGKGINTCFPPLATYDIFPGKK